MARANIKTIDQSSNKKKSIMLLKQNFFPIIFFSFFLIISFSACATTKDKNVSSEDLILEEGTELLKEKNYEKAELSFKKLLEEYPDSKLRVNAQMGLADSLFKQKKYFEAVFQYQQFIEIYPAHKDIDKARFFKGMAYFNQRGSIDRDQSFVNNAYDEFEYITINFNKSKYNKIAEEKKIICKENLARNVLYIGKFYYRTGAYHSAIGRFKDFLKEFSDLSFADEAYYYLVKLYFKKESRKSGLDIFEKLVSKFPESKYIKILKDNTLIKANINPKST